VTDKPWTARPVRFNVGVSERHLSNPPPVTANPYGVGGSGNVERTTSPTSGTTEGQDSPTNATVGEAQFTLALRYHLYLGGGVETGTLGRSGSSIAAVYGIGGVETTNRIGSLAAEVAYGWQTMRADVYSSDVDGHIFEPRVRGELWLSPQFTLGAIVGATPGSSSDGNNAWSAGVYLGVHSNLFDIWGQKGLPKSDGRIEPIRPVEPLE
jgi:hypothetical protein